ncbi:MAG: ATP-NAD kinase [Haloplanus sp.]
MLNVAVRGGDGDNVAATVGVAGASLVPEGDDAVDVVVAVGDEAIRSAAANPPDAPLLPVTPTGGRHLVARESLDGALAALAADDGRVVAHPILGVRRDGSVVARALRDVMLVTAAPASISEYAVTTAETVVQSVRADGVVLAAPMGSDGYAAAAGGSVLGADTGVAVVPVAPFSTAAETHVVDAADSLAVSVEREGDVALFADGVRHGSVDCHTDLRIEHAGALDVLVPTRTENF